MKLIYPACFYLEEDGAYSVTVPDCINTKAKENQINFSKTLQDSLLYKIANKME